jgi:hypothetical protein
MNSFRNNQDAVTSTLAYILFSSIFLVFFVIILLNSNNTLIKGPGNTVVKEQYRDIGNMISTTITDMYFIVPENGYIETNYTIPGEIGGETYIINADSASIDEIIEVRSTESDKIISVTLNGIASSMEINGTAYSSTSNHRISYNETHLP